MISPAPIEELSIPLAQESVEERDSRFSDLRGVQWRINLGILPSCASIYELRRVTADARRRYAGFRRRLLVDPHFLKDANNSPDLVMDNPLSQNPDSMWGQFFKNAELEKMVDQDLSRLYPEHGSYFQTSACQGILRRILLLWCLRHPECGYRQGMHELLAPLLYVLHVDVQRLSEVRKVYEHHFNDKFDDMSFPESDLVCNYKSLKLATEIEDANTSQETAAKASSLIDLDPEIHSIVLLTDAYGAEGELGIVLSERFMEHDAYCMFDALMGGACGDVAMADYFSPFPCIGSHTGLPPVIEASSAFYHLLSIVDSSLYSHLVELGVEPQYFALRWLRVLFGREFLLEDLLIIWDEIFASDNKKSASSAEEEEFNFKVLRSPRGAFIAAMAVSMLLHLRSSLLATETATSCLQRLLNFPENVDVKKLIDKAKSLQSLALDTSISRPAPALFDRSKSASVRGHSLSSGSISPRTPLNLIPESYWEEKWRVLHKEEAQHGSTGKCSSSGKKRLSERVKLNLGRADSCPSHLKIKSGKKDSRPSVRRSLLEDLSRELGLEEDLEKEGHGEADSQKDSFSGEAPVQERILLEDTSKEISIKKGVGSAVEETSLIGHTCSEENSLTFSASTSPCSSRANDDENDLDRSSVASNSSIDQDNVEADSEEPCVEMHNDPTLLVSDTISHTSENPEFNADANGKQLGGTKDRKLLLGKFQWLWKFGKSGGEGTSEKGGHSEASKSPTVHNNQNNVPVSSTGDGCSISSGETGDKNVMGTLKNLGQSMLENIQVLESVLQQDRNQVGSLENLSKNILVGKGQVTAVSALKELRKISNILSEM
ncbi:Tbc1 domain family member [Thalictrum thalictroides]|uniref:Tbc1 domain family member n=1 Tax=Thalictrum thalictroides TaxID=46969 RepID=A0A7J6W5D6_THATH|nr:Tbc1 domain family member [Thalictrum thalictroides]